MCMGAGQRNIEELASENIGCAVEAAKESVFRCRETSIRSLSASEAKLIESHLRPCGYSEPGGVGGNQAGEVDQVEENGLAELNKHQGAADLDERHPGEAD